uniref:C-type lectin domain-containing protein n=1 Tax=Aureoumbra lagunensis TaxID=44058 RepID=A0A7S3K180_9STRA
MRILNDRVSWNEARSLCCSAERMALVLDGWKNISLEIDAEWLWIGASRAVNSGSNFEWIDGSVVDESLLCQGDDLGFGNCLSWQKEIDCFAARECTDLGVSICESDVHDMWIPRQIQTPLRCQAIECFVANSDDLIENPEICWKKCLQEAPFSLMAAAIGLANHCCCGGECCAATTNAGSFFDGGKGIYAGTVSECQNYDDDDNTPHHLHAEIIFVLIAATMLCAIILTLFFLRFSFCCSRSHALSPLHHSSTEMVRSTIIHSTIVVEDVPMAQPCVDDHTTRRLDNNFSSLSERGDAQQYDDSSGPKEKKNKFSTFSTGPIAFASRMIFRSSPNPPNELERQRNDNTSLPRAVPADDLYDLSNQPPAQTCDFYY